MDYFDYFFYYYRILNLNTMSGHFVVFAILVDLDRQGNVQNNRFWMFSLHYCIDFRLKCVKNIFKDYFSY